MYKVVIIDDEIWITQLIKKSIDWEQLDMEVVGIANDGETGFDFINKYSPDIVITDIRMPGLDGLQLINKVNEKGLKTDFIIISGYQDFEYAQKAIKFGVNNYITKPIEEEELFNTLKDIYKKLKLKEEKELEQQTLKNRLSSSVDLIKNQFLSELIINNKKIKNLQSENQDYVINFPGELFQVIIFKIDTKISNRVTLDHRTLFYEQLVNIVDKLEDNINIIAHVNKIICIFNYNENEQDKIDKTINCIFNDLRNNLVNITHKIFITCSMGSIEQDINKLNESYMLAEKALRTRVYLGTDRIITLDDYDSFENINIKDILSTDRIKQFICEIQLFDIDKIKKWIIDTLEIFTSNISINPSILIDVSLEIINLTQKELVNLNIKDKHKYSKEEIKELLDECLSLKEILDKVIEVVTELIDDSRSENIDNRKPIEIAKEYISKHYNESISLQEISEKVYLNPTYFSELFKKEVGVNFSDYLINHRLEIARELLQNPKYKISQVSQKVGYSDSRYFSKLFKKVVGVTPKQYRKLYI